MGFRKITATGTTILIVLSGVLLTSGCWAHTNEPDTNANDRPTSQAIIDLLIDEQYTDVYERYASAELKTTVSSEDWNETWRNQLNRSGEYVGLQSIDESSHSSSQSDQTYTIVEAVLEYTDVVVQVRLTLNEHGQLIGHHLADVYANAHMPANVVEEHVLVGQGSAFELEGTLTLPAENQENLPAAIIVHGSGPVDRDGTVYSYKPYRDIAWGLAEQGIAVLRYDKRTYVHGERMAADRSDLTVREETVDDAIRAANLLKDDPRLDANNIFILGHSLGGMLAPRIDAQGADVAGIVILAGTIRPLWEVIGDQHMALLENDERLDAESKAEQTEWVQEQREVAEQLTGMSEAEASEVTVFGLPGIYFKEMDQFDTTAAILDAETPLMVLQGETDFQVYVEPDFQLWEALLADHEYAQLHRYPNVNHFFIYYEGPDQGTLDEYEHPGRVDERVLSDMSQWILDQATTESPIAGHLSTCTDKLFTVRYNDMDAIGGTVQ